MESKVLGLLPARGGSKGIIKKNLRKVAGKPLVAWASSILSNSQGIDRKICCTDDSEIAKVAREYGLETPWIRPSELSQDSTLVVDVLVHAVEKLSVDTKFPFTHVVLVQATSPTVTSADIEGAIKMAIETNADTVITGFDAGEKHPARMFKFNNSNTVEWLFEVPARMVRRQDLKQVFIRTGLVYVVKVETLFKYNSLYGPNIQSIIVPEEKAINIDEEKDILLAENYFKENGIGDFA